MSLGLEESGIDYAKVEICIVALLIIIPEQKPVQKPQFLMALGCISALGKGNLHFDDGCIHAEKYTEILEQHRPISHDIKTTD